MQGGGIFLLRRVKGERKNFLKILVWNSTAAKPPTGRFCWTVHDGSLLGPFSLTKRAMHEQRNWTKFNFMSRNYKAKFCREIKRDLALSTIRYFERCGARPKALPLETAAFWKRLAKTLCFYNPSFSRRGAWSFFFAYFLFLPKRK